MLRSLRFLLLPAVLCLGLVMEAQAVTFTFHSSAPGSQRLSSGNTQSASGYTATITLTPIALVAPATCPWGYSYNLEYRYEIAYSGNMPQNASLYTLQAVFKCGSDQLGTYDLPKTISTSALSGTQITTTNPYRNAADCATATLASQGCLSGDVTLTIAGPDLPQQTLSLPVNATPLPVTLVSFDARHTSEGVSFAWTTANEEKGDRYFLERSANSTDWTPLAVVHSVNQGNYDFTDRQPAVGMNYYRLRNVDAQGVVTYSRIIGLKVAASSDAAPQISLSPNPANGERVHVSGIQTPADWNFTLTNAAGQVLLNQPLSHPEIMLPQLPSGLYFTRFTNSVTNEVKILKLIRE